MCPDDEKYGSVLYHFQARPLEEVPSSLKRTWFWNVEIECGCGTMRSGWAR